MLLIPAITTLLTAGVAFYLRFLVALVKECFPRWTNRKPSRLRLEVKSTNQQPSSKPRQTRAASQITEIAPNTNSHKLRRDRA
jgi:hypothetical protein